MPLNEPQVVSVWLIVATLFGSLVVGSVIRWFALRNADPEYCRDRMSSLVTWWGLAVAFSIAILCGPIAICILMAIVSCVAFFEFDSILANTPVTLDHVFARQRWLIYLLIAVNYWLIAIGRISEFYFFLPIVAAFLVATNSILQGKKDGYIRATSGRFWGLLTTGYFLSYSAVLASGEVNAGSWEAQIGWFVYLVSLTQINDIAQSIVGRKLGAKSRFRLAPNLSPNKTWEGAVGGFVFTILFAVLLAVPLTTLLHHRLVLGWFDIEIPFLTAIVAGALISATGIFGDLNMSGLKRDANVKDSSRLLPGMGGVIDRIDSLTFTAPAFYVYLNYCCSS